MKENDNKVIIRRRELYYDFWANMVCKILLKKRDSKRVFSVKDDAEKYIASLTEKDLDGWRIPEEIEFKNKIELEMKYSSPLYVISPEGGSTTGKKVIYLHGGAWVNQPTKQHCWLVDDLVTLSGCELYFYVYPKAPAHDFRLAYSKLEELFCDLAEKYGSENIVIMGDSAGATMAITFCDMMRKKGGKLPKELVLYSPVADIRMTNKEIAKIFPKDPMQGVDGLLCFIKAWANGESLDSPVLNPIETELGSLPEMTIFGGNKEVFNPDVRIFAQKVNDAGGKVKYYQYRNMYHCFVLFKLIAAKRVKRLSAGLINR